MDCNNSRSGIKSRAIILRCSDETYLEIVQRPNKLHDYYPLFSKSSNLKPIIREEGW